MAHVARCAVAVVRQRLDHNGDAAGPVALVNDLFVVVGAGVAGGFFDDALDVVVGHVVRLRLGDDVLQLGVARRVGTALAHGDGDLATDLGEDLRAGVIGLFFLSFDGAPFGMSGHKNDPFPVSILRFILSLTFRTVKSVLRRRRRDSCRRRRDSGFKVFANANH